MKHILFILLFYVGVGSVGHGFPWETIQHPGSRLDANALRLFLVNFIQQDDELIKFFDGVDFAETLPYYIELKYQEHPPDVMISSIPLNPFASLGNWSIYFGTRSDEAIIDPVEYPNIQCIVYTRTLYKDFIAKKIDVTQLVIDVRSSQISRKSKKYDTLKSDGWYILHGTGEDRKSSRVIRTMEITHGGGRYSNEPRIGTGVTSAALYDWAFLGYSKRLNSGNQ